MRFARWILTFGLTITAAAAFGQQWRQGKGRVEGTVKDKDGNPIADATISMRYKETGQGPDIKTSKKGYWAIFGLNGGMWDLDVVAAGYQTKKTSVLVTEFQRVPPMDLVLDPEVKQEQPHEEISVGGKKVSKETAEAIENANTAMNAKDYATARANYEKALVELPDNLSLLTNLEFATYLAKDYDAALKYAQRVSEQKPDDTNTWMMIAEIQLQKGNFDAGKAALAKVPEDAIKDPGPYLNMGILYYNKGKPSEADVWFTKAIAKKPEDVEIADAYYYRGLARFQEKHAADAKADLKKYLAMVPTGENADTAKELLRSMK